MDETQVVGCILGMAVGDALGLPYEGVSRHRQPRLLGPPVRHRFLFRRGMISDDTEHSCLVLQSLIATGDDDQRFTSDLGKRMRWWFASLPAGLGRATLKACVRLWLGVPATRSGVFSAGNGPAMRAVILGACFDDVDTMAKFVSASSRITHTDPKAEYGALAVALAAWCGCQVGTVSSDVYMKKMRSLVGANAQELLLRLDEVVASVNRGQSTSDFARSNGMDRGVSGYVYQTVPIVIHAWLSHPRDYREAVTAAIQCGGDADTTAAIVGGIVGATTGEAGIPDAWLTGIVEWPRSVKWMRCLAKQMARTHGNANRPAPPETSWLACLIRNLFFLVVVLIHGFRRLFPPY